MRRGGRRNWRTALLSAAVVVAVAGFTFLWPDDGGFTTPEALADHMAVLFEAGDSAALAALAPDHVVGSEAHAAELLASVDTSELTDVTWVFDDYQFPAAVSVSLRGDLGSSDGKWSARVPLYRDEGRWTAGLGTPIDRGGRLETVVKTAPPLWMQAQEWDEGAEQVMDLDHGLRLEATVLDDQLCIASRYGETTAEFPDLAPHPSDRTTCTFPSDERLKTMTVGTGYGAVQTHVIGAVALDGGTVMLRFPSGHEWPVQLVPSERWPDLAFFGIPIGWEDDNTPEVVLLDDAGHEVEARTSGAVRRASRSDRESPASDVEELGPGAIELGSLADGEHFGRLTGYVDTEELAALRFVPQQGAPVLVEVDRAHGRFQVYDGRSDPPQVEVGWHQLVLLLNGEYVFPLYWTGLVELTVEEAIVTGFAVVYTP